MNSTNLDFKTALVTTVIVVITGYCVVSVMGFEFNDVVNRTAQLIVGR